MTVFRGRFVVGVRVRSSDAFMLVSFLLILVASSDVFAEPRRGNTDTPMGAALPDVPNLQLTLPSLAPKSPASQLRVLPVSSPTEASPSRWMDGYRAFALNLGEARYLTDIQLSFQFEGFAWRLGGFRIEAGAEISPVSQSICPVCKSGMWSSRLRLGYDLGTVGPVQSVTPSLELQRKDERIKRAGTGLVRFGVGGAF